MSTFGSMGPLPALDVGWISSTPFAASPRLPTPYQLRTMSSRAMVPPASTSMIVCLTGFEASSPVGVKVSWYLVLVNPVLARRMSDCHLELTPGRWPTEGMMSAFAGSACLVVELTGVTSVTETGVFDVVSPSATMPFDEVEGVMMVTITVPVKVPLGRSVGSAVTVRSTTLGGRSPADGETLSHGLSTRAVKLTVPPTPGTCTISTTTSLLPAGMLTFGFGSFGEGGGAMTTREVAEYAPNLPAQGRNARTR